jgi:hypothetical protein
LSGGSERATTAAVFVSEARSLYLSLQTSNFDLVPVLSTFTRTLSLMPLLR